MSAERLRLLQDRLDLRTVLGSGAHPTVLIEAGIEDADVFIAVTNGDNRNIMAAQVARTIFNIEHVIVRDGSLSDAQRDALARLGAIEAASVREATWWRIPPGSP